MDNKLSDENGKERLITGILEDSRKEADNIMHQAEASVKQRKETVEKQIRQILSQAEEKAKEQAESIISSIDSAISVEKQRLVLKVMDKTINSTLKKVKNKIHKMIGRPEYRDILLDWIVEAAFGLNAKKAYVNATREEIQYIDKDILKKAEVTLSSLTGKKVILEKSDDSPLLAQGVVLTAEDGKTAFNNQVHTRLLRYQTEIRKMMYDILYKTEDTP